jgi:chromate reductase
MTARAQPSRSQAARERPTPGHYEVFLQVTDGFFDAQGGFANADTQKFLQTWMDQYVEWVQTHAQ